MQVEALYKCRLLLFEGPSCNGGQKPPPPPHPGGVLASKPEESHPPCHCHISSSWVTPWGPNAGKLVCGLVFILLDCNE